MESININQINNHSDIIKLYNHLIQHCCDKQQNNTLAFAFILYRSSNEVIDEILHNRSCRNSLHDISGNRLCVYSLSAHDNSVIPHIHNHMYETINSNPIQMMTQYSYPEINQCGDFINPKDITDTLFKELLNDGKKLVYPSVLFFRVNNGVISDSFSIDIVGETKEDIMKELKFYFEISDEYLKKITIGIKSEKVFDDIFNELQSNVNTKIVIDKGKKIFFNILKNVPIKLLLKTIPC